MDALQGPVVKNNEPELYEKIYKLVLVQDYLIYKLTGNLVTLEGAGTMTGALDIASPRKWAKDIIKALGSGKTFGSSPFSRAGLSPVECRKRWPKRQAFPKAFRGDRSRRPTLRNARAGVVEPGELGINGGLHAPTTGLPRCS